MPEMLGNRRQMSAESRRPIFMVERRSGIGSPPPTGTNSPMDGRGIRWTPPIRYNPIKKQKPDRLTPVSRRIKKNEAFKFYTASAPRRKMVSRRNSWDRRGNPGGSPQTMTETPDRPFYSFSRFLKE